MNIRRGNIINSNLQPCATDQRGAALVFSLVILLVLTILGISALRTSSLEQLMAGNIQELTRAFAAADSGLEKSRQSANMPKDVVSFGNLTEYLFSDMGAKAIAKTPVQLQIASSGAQRSSSPTGIGTAQYAFYDHQITGVSTNTNARVILHQGLKAGAPTDPFSPLP